MLFLEVSSKLKSRKQRVGARPPVTGC